MTKILQNYASTNCVKPRYSADFFFTNGRIYTVNVSQSWVDSVAVRAGRFQAIGT